jgi:hypothetical protein
MAARILRIRRATHAKLRELAKEEGATVQEVLERAVEAYRRDRFLKDLAEDFAALRANPKAWAAEVAERKAWSTMRLADAKDK